MPTTYYNRATGKVEEERILGDSMLRLAYLSPIRGMLRWPLFCCAAFSRLMGWYCNRGMSRRKIQPTIDSLQIDMEQFVIPENCYSCFNDFFARRVKPGMRCFAENGLCSPADSRLTVFPRLSRETCIPVKGASFSLSELLQDEALAHEFENGSLAVFRLCPADYHRYHYPDSGAEKRHWRIPGGYHSVHPIALQQGIKVFTTNVREISLLKLEHFGDAVYIEVGAFGVASINQTHKAGAFERGDEKGYFAFGGSTVILVLKENAAKFDGDILAQSEKGVETLVKAGEHIADA